MFSLLLAIIYLSFIGLLVLGFGSSPVYPCIIHSTPINFGAENAQSLVGIQMASAYVGSTFMPPRFGLLAQFVGISLYPWFLLLFAGLVLYLTEKLNKTVQI